MGRRLYEAHNIHVHMYDTSHHDHYVRLWLHSMYTWMLCIFAIRTAAQCPALGAVQMIVQRHPRYGPSQMPNLWGHRKAAPRRLIRRFVRTSLSTFCPTLFVEACPEASPKSRVAGVSGVWDPFIIRPSSHICWFKREAFFFGTGFLETTYCSLSDLDLTWWR